MITPHNFDEEKRFVTGYTAMFSLQLLRVVASLYISYNSLFLIRAAG